MGSVRSPRAAYGTARTEAMRPRFRNGAALFGEAERLLTTGRSRTHRQPHARRDRARGGHTDPLALMMPRSASSRAGERSLTAPVHRAAREGRCPVGVRHRRRDSAMGYGQVAHAGVAVAVDSSNLQRRWRVAGEQTSRPPRPRWLPRVGVVLAAGRSERISSLTRGGSKALLRLGGLNLVERAVQTLLAAGVESVVVVVGHDAEPVAAVVDRLAARPGPRRLRRPVAGRQRRVAGCGEGRGGRRVAVRAAHRRPRVRRRSDRRAAGDRCACCAGRRQSGSRRLGRGHQGAGRGRRRGRVR